MVDPLLCLEVTLCFTFLQQNDSRTPERCKQVFMSLKFLSQLLTVLFIRGVISCQLNFDKLGRTYRSGEEMSDMHFSRFFRESRDRMSLVTLNPSWSDQYLQASKLRAANSQRQGPCRLHQITSHRSYYSGALGSDMSYGGDS